MQADKRLIRQCQRGNRKAQKRFYDKYAPLMLGICVRYVSNRDDAEDILQESFVNIFKNISTLKNNDSIFFWMRRIVINKAIRFLTTRKSNFETESFYVDEYSDPEDVNQFISESNCKDIIGVINELPVGYRTVFNLFALEGYKHREIAELLGISEGTSKSQYFAAKKMLQSKMQKRLVLEKDLFILNTEMVAHGI